MVAFFMITGSLFVIGSSIILHYIYSMFPINKLTIFLKPTEDTIFNNTSISIIPLILWSFIELPVLGENNYFIWALLLNIFLSVAINYIFIYGYSLISKNDSDIIEIISIIIGTSTGFFVNGITLVIGTYSNMLYSIAGVLIIAFIFILIKKYPPKSNFFRGKNM